MNEKIICEKCGHEMSYFIEGSTCGTTCKNCGWGCVTSYIEPIRLDTNEYKLVIHPIENPSTDSLRCISQLLMCNYLKAKEKLHSEIVFANNAIEIKRIAAELAKHEIDFIITPDFPYSISV